jgi:hypothetical protein
VTVTPIPTDTPSPTLTSTPSPTITPTRTPTSTPTKTTAQHIADNLVDNIAVLIGTILSFILGIPAALMVIWTIWRQVKKAQEQKRLSGIREVNNLTIDGVQSRINDIDDLQILEDWLSQEKQQKNRKAVIEVIEKRIKALIEKPSD